LPEVRGEAILVCDASTGRVLFERNADQLRPVASTQKLLTALIVAESGNLSDDVVVEASDTDCEPTKLYMKPGEKYERYKLLQVLLVKSMNDVARCLARDNAGSLEAFADKMNAKAREIGMKNSRFMNPNGLPAAGQYSNARDMARLALHVYRNRVLRGIVSLRTLTWVSPTGRPTVYENTNRVLKYFGLCNGMKTGYTNAAGHCLVTSASDGGRHVVCVILGSTKGIIATDSYRLLSWGLYQLGASPAAVSARN
jgi:D-alanyl-D-alanine carboxypeptidase (penicillin-binding protein 5/6)